MVLDEQFVCAVLGEQFLRAEARARQGPPRPGAGGRFRRAAGRGPPTPAGGRARATDSGWRRGTGDRFWLAAGRGRPIPTGGGARETGSGGRRGDQELVLFARVKCPVAVGLARMGFVLQHALVHALNLGRRIAQRLVRAGIFFAGNGPHTTSLKAPPQIATRRPPRTSQSSSESTHPFIVRICRRNER